MWLLTNVARKFMSNLILRIGLGLSLAFMLFANLLGGDHDSDAGSGLNLYEAFPTDFSPAPYTFAVWAPIFLACIALTVYLCSLPPEQSSLLSPLLGWMTSVFFLTALTTYTPIGLSNFAVTGMLVALIFAYREVLALAPTPAGFYWCVREPVAIFLAWAFVATILNTCQWLTSKGWTVGSAEAAFLIGLAAVVGLVVVLCCREPAFAVVLTWAFWGIVAARADNSSLVIAAGLGTMFLLGAVICLLLRNPKHVSAD